MGANKKKQQKKHFLNTSIQIESQNNLSYIVLIYFKKTTCRRILSA